jgi:hypothetical protein
LDVRTQSNTATDPKRQTVFFIEPSISESAFKLDLAGDQNTVDAKISDSCACLSGFTGALSRNCVDQSTRVYQNGFGRPIALNSKANTRWHRL